MSPRAAILGRNSDGNLRDAKVYNLPVSEYIIAIRYDGSLYFANVPYFEDTILEAVSRSPSAKHLLIVSEGINQLDASGDEVIHHIVERLRSNGIRVVFSGLKKQVIDVMSHSGLFAYIGQENVFPDEDKALDSIYAEVLEADPNAQRRLMKQQVGSADGV
jgi:SulP family sulfate permease